MRAGPNRSSALFDPLVGISAGQWPNWFIGWQQLVRKLPRVALPGAPRLVGDSGARSHGPILRGGDYWARTVGLLRHSDEGRRGEQCHRLQVMDVGGIRSPDLLGVEQRECQAIAVDCGCEGPDVSIGFARKTEFLAIKPIRAAVDDADGFPS